MTFHRIAGYGTAAALACVAFNSTAHADGGRLCASERAGPWQVTVFASPAPLRAGVVDIGVLVLQTASYEIAPDVTVAVDATHAETGRHVREQASTAAATNKLFRSALCDLTVAGRWRVAVTISGPAAGAHEVEFDVDVRSEMPGSWNLAYWIGWPVVPIALFLVHQCLVKRKQRLAG